MDAGCYKHRALVGFLDSSLDLIKIIWVSCNEPAIKQKGQKSYGGFGGSPDKSNSRTMLNNKRCDNPATMDIPISP